MNIYIFLFNLYNKIFIFSIYVYQSLGKINKKENNNNELNQKMKYNCCEKKNYYLKNKTNYLKKKDNIYKIPDANFISDDGPIMF